MAYEFITADPEQCIQPTYTQLVTVTVVWAGKILLIYRLTEPFKGKHSVPGGHVERGELYHQAAARELNEETGIQAKELKAQITFIDHAHQLECHGFSFTSPDGTFSSPPDEEQEVLGWKDLKEVLALPLTPGLRELFQNTLSK